MPLLKSPWLHGLHEGHEESGLQHYLDKPSWIVFTEGIGFDPNDRSGGDYRQWTQKGYWPIVRLNNGYEPSGTIPHKDNFEKFAQRVQNYVAASQGDVYYWIIGNEPNGKWERPHGWVISPEDYALCFKLCRQAIKKVKPGVVVMPAPVAVWNVDTGDWVAYFRTVMRLLEGLCDGICLHTYSHGSDPGLITSEAKMNPPYQNRNYHFRAYQDLMREIPQSMRSLPVLITESDQDEAWADKPNTWIQEAYREIDRWNRDANNQTIQALVMYRWPKRDKWQMVGKPHVINDFETAVRVGYPSVEPRFFKSKPPVVEPVEPPQKPVGDKWAKTLAFVLKWEGGWADHPNDPGGATMKGITIGTYIRWHILNSLPLIDQHGNLRVISKEEYANFSPEGIANVRFHNKERLRNIPDSLVAQIYFEWYWLASGADKMVWPMCLAHCDLAVNGGVARAEQALAINGQDFWKYMVWRRDWYKRLDTFPIFGSGWMKRCRDLILTAYE